MPYASPSTMTFGDGSDAASSTQTGSVVLTATTPPGCTITRLTGDGGGNASIVPSDAAALKATLASALVMIDAAPAKGFALDMVETPANDDPEKVEYLENDGDIKIVKSATQNQTMAVDTARGLKLALDALVP